MPVCPECRFENPKGRDTCLRCGYVAVDRTPPRGALLLKAIATSALAVVLLGLPVFRLISCAANRPTGWKEIREREEREAQGAGPSVSKNMLETVADKSFKEGDWRNAASFYDQAQEANKLSRDGLVRRRSARAAVALLDAEELLKKSPPRRAEAEALLKRIDEAHLPSDELRRRRAAALAGR